MAHLSSKMWRTIAVVAIVVAMAEVAEAQREGGRRGAGRGFPVSSVRLATADEVQAELKLSDEQKDRVAEINDKLRDDVRDAFQGGGGFEQMQKLNQEASAKLAEVLDEGQQKRLLGISIQVNGPGSLVEPAVLKELNVSEEQKTKLADVREAGMRSFLDAFQEMREKDLSRDEMRPKFDELRRDTDEKLMAVLTSEQQAQLESLKGEPVEIDMSQFRGPGGRGGFGGPGRRDDGERGESDGGQRPSTESSE